MAMKKVFTCKCGQTSSFEFNTDLSLDDVTISARCPSCSMQVMITLSGALEKSPSSESSYPSPSYSSGYTTKPVSGSDDNYQYPHYGEKDSTASSFDDDAIEYQSAKDIQNEEREATQMSDDLLSSGSSYSQSAGREKKKEPTDDENVTDAMTEMFG